MHKALLIAGILGCLAPGRSAMEKMEFKDVEKYVSMSPLIFKSEYTINGRKLSLLQRSVIFEFNKGIKIPILEWKAENKDSELLTLLNAGIKTIGKPSGYYTFKLIVHDVNEETFFFVKRRFFVIEGLIIDPKANKEIICANVAGSFMTKEKAEKEDGKFTFQSAVDHLIDGIKTELLKPGSTSDESSKQNNPRSYGYE